MPVMQHSKPIGIIVTFGLSKLFFFFLLLKLSFNKQYPQFMTAKIIYFDFYMLSYLHNQQN